MVQTSSASRPVLWCTPQSRGSGNISKDIETTGLNIETIRPWIRRDMDNARQCPFDVMLSDFLSQIWSSEERKADGNALLQLCLENVLSICNGRSEFALKMKEQLTMYSCDSEDGNGNRRAKHEAELYDDFVLAANYALLSLENINIPGFPEPPSFEDRILFQAHHATAIKAIHGKATSILKPDLVVLSVGDARRAHKRRKDTATPLDYYIKLATEKPDKQGVCWHSIRTVVEMKTGRRKRTQVPPEYAIKDYSIPRKEYLTRLQYGEVESRSTTVSQGDEKPVVSSKRKRKSPGDSENTSSSKRRKNNEQVRDLTAQAGNYAAEMMSSHIGRTHALTLVIDGDVLYLWRFDREGVIECSGLNFIDDLPRFLVLLFAMQRFENHQWGVNRDIDSTFGPPPEELSVSFHTEQGIVNIALHVDPTCPSMHFGLNGRATNVLPAALPDDDDLVVKLCWPERSRTPEPEIIAQAYEIDDDGVRNHLPDVVAHHTFEGTSTARIRDRLNLGGDTGNSSGSRVLRLVGFRVLRPITELADEELLCSWWHGVLCHRILWSNGIRHRDVSPPNLMYRRDKTGQVVGVLNDFDLATVMDVPTGNERTGTMPFMALSLLDDEALCGQVKHLYEHDAESFIWVLLWISVQYKNGKLRQEPPLNSWLGIDARGCREKKFWFLFHNEWKKLACGDERNALVLAKCQTALRHWYLQTLQLSNSARNDGSRANAAFMELLQGPYTQHSLNATSNQG